MDPRRDLLELSILYDTARAFLGPRPQREILQTALLSLMGACGARFALYLERDGSQRLLPKAAEGLNDPPQEPLPLTARAAAILDQETRSLGGADLDALGPRFVRPLRDLGVELLVPMRRPGPSRDVLALGPKLLGEPYRERDLIVAREIVTQASMALGPRRQDSDAAAEISALRKKFPALQAIRGESESTASLFAELVGLSEFDLPVLVLGETGTGKELVAHAIHELSRRRDRAFEAINCAAIPRDLMASALFGHEKGAFTGADSTVQGAFERAAEGTIFLDEIGDMPLDTQAMLLRVLEERSFRRVGGTSIIPAKARVISATNRDLLREVEEGRFRRDLFYRLQMYTVYISPLRDRAEEIPTLAAHVFESFRGKGHPDVTATPEFLAALQRRTLKGNVRELESLIAGAIVRAGEGGVLGPEHLSEEVPGAARTGSTRSAETGPSGESRADGDAVAANDGDGDGDENGSGVTIRGLGRPGTPNHEVVPWENMEREYIRSVLRLTDGNRREAARLMGIPRTTLTSKIKRFGLAPKSGRATPG